MNRELENDQVLAWCGLVVLGGIAAASGIWWLLFICIIVAVVLALACLPG